MVSVGPDVASSDTIEIPIMNTIEITPNIFFSSLLFLFPLILLMHRYHLLKLPLANIVFIEYITRCIFSH